MDYNSLKMEQLGSVRDMFGLKGKKALVTGAAGGIGRSCAHAFAEFGGGCGADGYFIPADAAYRICRVPGN